MNQLAGKVALVTGAGQGVGQGIAFALAESGAAVAVAGRTLDKCEHTCREIQRRGGRAIAVACDVKQPAALRHCVEQVLKNFERLNILVNNAQEGHDSFGDLLTVSEAAVSACWESGAMATLRLMRLCHPHLRGDGVIINLASTAAMRWDTSQYGAYTAVKEAIRALSRTAACEWGKDGIRTNVVMPLAASPGLSEWMRWNPADAEAFMAAIPLQRVGDCEADIGRFVAVLCSDDCRYINGQSIAVDGGKAYLG